MYKRHRRCHARVSDLRHDFQHKATIAIAWRYARIGVETLNVSGMVRNRRLSRAIADSGMNGFISMLEYRSELYRAEVVRIDRRYASSKVCSGFGGIAVMSESGLVGVTVVAGGSVIGACRMWECAGPGSRGSIPPGASTVSNTQDRLLARHSIRPRK